MSSGNNIVEPEWLLREIADLGNTRSGTVRRLVEYVSRLRDGYDLFVKMGLTRGAPNRNDWSARSADDLTRMLRPWSAKQVRTHFDRLRQANLITAERDPTNGPWRYALPEQFCGIDSPFRHLPSPEELSNPVAVQPQAALCQPTSG